MTRRNTKEDFWALVDIKDQKECWLWKGRIEKGFGYGCMSWNGRPTRAHRISAQLVLGNVNGTVVLHKCDRPSCVNPHHLTIGTHAENVSDKVSKGRQSFAKGSKNGCSKLDEEDVVKIKQRILMDEPLKEIAKQFQVSYGTIYGIKHGKTWTHVQT